MTSIPTKFCRKCDQRLPVEAFSKCSQNKDGLQGACKKCKRAYVTANPEIKAASDKRWREANAGRMAAYQRDYYLADPEKAKARSAAWMAANPERARQRAREYAASHREEALTRAQLWAANNTAQATANKALYRARNRVAVRELNATRKAVLRADPAITVEALRERDGELCAYCRVVMSFEPMINGYNPDKASLDHVLALKNLGSHTFDNTVLCCLRCNSSKGDRLLEEWLLSRTT